MRGQRLQRGAAPAATNAPPSAGAGPRIRIGNHFAPMEGHLLLAALVQRVTFEPVPGQAIVPDPKITIRLRDAIGMVVRRRDTDG